MTWRDVPTGTGAHLGDARPLVASAQSEPTPTAAQTAPIPVKHYPSGFERAVRMIREFAAILALLLASVLMLLALSTYIVVSHRLGQIGDDFSTDPGPVPTATGCPFGPGECGD